MTLRLLSVALLLLLPPAAVLAQSGPPTGGTRVEFNSLNLANAPERIFGYLYLPADAAGGKRVPAMVVVHGSGGVRDTREGDYGRSLSAAGVAVLAIDAFTPRGVSTTVDDQSRVSGGQMVRDAFAALAFLATQPAIDPARIGVMGMSKGGTVAMQSAEPREQAEARRRLGAGSFAVHVPLYPGCTSQYRNPHMAAPMLILIGADDTYTGVKSCAEYAERIRSAGGRVEFKTYPGAVHGFDGDISTLRHFHVSAAQNYSNCVYFTEDDGRVVTRAGTLLDPGNVPAATATLQRECMKLGATVGGNPGAKAQALADIKAFLKNHLMQ